MLRGGVEPTHSKGFNQLENPVVLSEYERPQGSSNGRGFFGLRPQDDAIYNNETNLFTYSLSHLFTSKKSAFTLAEVLITLGIIGVVAAITIPTLIQNYKKQVYVNQLKKSVSMLEQGFKKMLADEGVDRLDEISGLDELNDDGYPYLEKYFKCSHIQSNMVYPNGFYELGGKHHNGKYGVGDFYSCNDGSLVAIDFVNMFDYGTITIDVNGDKKLPNKLGRDIFDFDISQDGRLIPQGSEVQAKRYGDYTDYWANNGTCGTPGSSTIPANTLGWPCAARIIENGWKMDY